MGKLIEAIKENSDQLIASIVFDILLVGYWDMAIRINDGWSTIIGTSTARGVGWYLLRFTRSVRLGCKYYVCLWCNKVPQRITYGKQPQLIDSR